MKAVIFGVNGQDGYYLSQLLNSNNIEVIGISRDGNFIKGNICDRDFVDSIVKEHKPDFVFHLAANSSTHHSTLFENHETISTGTIILLESVRLYSPSTKVFISGSALQFRNIGQPISEKTEFEASSPYAVARIQSVYAARYFREKYDIKAYVGYFFNHDSPLRTEKHLNKKIVNAVHSIVSGKESVLELGSIDVSKEFNFAGDIVEAVWILMNQEQVFEAVIGSGKAHTIREWVDKCFQLANRNWHNYVVIKNNYHPEYNILVSDPSLIKSIGWFPRVNFGRAGGSNDE
jgi:GDPmannose 4,6-dehydratase